MHLLEKFLTPSTLPQAIVTAAVLLAIAYVLGMMVKQNTKYAVILCLVIAAVVLAIAAPNALFMLGAVIVIIAALVWL